MNKKILTSAILGCVLATNAMAASQSWDKGKCDSSPYTVWAMNIKDTSTGKNGVCVPNDTCSADVTRIIGDGLCKNVFSNDFVSRKSAVHLAGIYCRRVLGWDATTDCDALKMPDNSIAGEKYSAEKIGCKDSGGQYVVFKFRGASENGVGLAEESVSFRQKLFCTAMGGELCEDGDSCCGINEENCSRLADEHRRVLENSNAVISQGFDAFFNKRTNICELGTTKYEIENKIGTTKYEIKQKQSVDYLPAIQVDFPTAPEKDLNEINW